MRRIPCSWSRNQHEADAPETMSAFHASGNVVWSHTSGRAGIVFDRAAGPEMKKLQER